MDEETIFTETGESPEDERQRLYNQDKEVDFGKLDTDRVVQAFKASLRVMLHCERLVNSGKTYETEIIDKCSYALNNLVELHYDKVRLVRSTESYINMHIRDTCKMLFGVNAKKLKS